MRGSVLCSITAMLNWRFVCAAGNYSLPDDYSFLNVLLKEINYLLFCNVKNYNESNLIQDIVFSIMYLNFFLLL